MPADGRKPHPCAVCGEPVRQREPQVRQCGERYHKACWERATASRNWLTINEATYTVPAIPAKRRGRPKGAPTTVLSVRVPTSRYAELMPLVREYVRQLLRG